MAPVKPKEMLVLDPPNELKFVGPFTRPVSTTLVLQNTTDQLIQFKIKTTAPKRYCVRPNFGSVLPYDSAKVEICLQPFMYDPAEKNKHKFMVQCIASSTETDELTDLLKGAAPELLRDAKLKCVFEMPATMASGGDTSASGATEKIKEELASPKSAFNEEKISNIQTSSDQSESLVELRQLRDENNSLRKENINLKEQVVRLRCSTVKPTVDEAYTPIIAEKQVPMLYLAMAFLAAIFGLVLGKYVF